jgi:hypothetical protein
MLGVDRTDAAEDNLDPRLTERIFGVLASTVCRYFRVRVLDGGNIPAGRALLVGCHSGVFGWDATCLVVAVHQATGRFTRNVGDHFFLTLGPVARFLQATGLVPGSPGVVEETLERDHLVLLFPGGAADMLRPIWRRYRLAPHRGFAPGPASAPGADLHPLRHSDPLHRAADGRRPPGRR